MSVLNLDSKKENSRRFLSLLPSEEKKRKSCSQRAGLESLPALHEIEQSLNSIGSDKSKLMGPKIAEIEPFGMQDISYPEIFPLAEKCYACLYGNYYAIMNNNESYEYIIRNSPPLCKTYFVNIERKEKIITFSSIFCKPSQDSVLYIEIIWYCHANKTELRRILFDVLSPISTGSPQINLFILEHTKQLSEEDDPMEKILRFNTAVISIFEEKKFGEGLIKSVDYLAFNLKYIESKKSEVSFTSKSTDGTDFTETTINLQQDEKVIWNSYKNGSLHLFTNTSMYETLITLKMGPVEGMSPVYVLENIKYEMINKIIGFEETLIKSLRETFEEDEKIFNINRKFKKQLTSDKLQILSACFCSNRIIVLASNNIIYEVSQGKIVNRESLIHIMIKNSTENFYGETPTIQEVHSMQGKKEESSVLVAKILCTNDEHFSIKFLTFKVSHRCIDFYSKVEQIEEHLIEQGLFLCKTHSSHTILSSKMKSVAGFKLTVFFQMFLRSNESSKNHNGGKIAMMDLCLINKFSVEDLLEADLKEKMRQKNTYIQDIFQINYYNDSQSPNNEMIFTHSTEGFILATYDDQKEMVQVRRQCKREYELTKNKKIRGLTYSEPSFLRIPFFFSFTCLSIDPLALQLIGCNKEKMKVMHIVDDQIIKGAEIYLKDSRSLSYDKYGEYILINSSHSMILISATNFHLIRKITTKGEIFEVKVREKIILVKWKEPIYQKILVSVFFLNNCIFDSFETFSIPVDSITTKMEASNMALMLIQGDQMRVIPIELKKNMANGEENRWFGFNNILEMKDEKKKTCSYHQKYENSFNFESFMKLSPPEASSPLLCDSDQFVTAYKGNKNYIFVGTNLGKLKVYFFEKNCDLMKVSLLISKTVVNCPILQLILKNQMSQVIHVLTQVGSILTLKFSHDCEESNFKKLKLNSEFLQTKTQHQILNKVILQHKLMTSEKFDFYATKIKEQELILLKLKGDLEELNLKIKPLLKSETIDMEKQIHLNVIKAKLQESAMRLTGKQKVQRYQQFYWKEQQKQKKSKIMEITKEYEERYSEQFEEYRRINNRREAITHNFLMKKKQLEMNNRSEFGNFVKEHKEKMQEIESEINKLQCHKSMSHLFDKIQEQINTEELKQLKVEVKQKINRELSQELQNEKQNRWKLWSLNEHYNRKKMKITEFEHEKVKFIRDCSHLKQKLEEKRSLVSEFEQRMDNLLDENYRQTSSSDLNELINKRNISISQIKKISWRIEEAHRKKVEKEKMYQFLEKSISSMSQELNSLKKISDKKSKEISEVESLKKELKIKLKQKKNEQLISKMRLSTEIKKVSEGSSIELKNKISHKNTQNHEENRKVSWSMHEQKIQNKNKLMKQKQKNRNSGRLMASNIELISKNVEYHKILDHNKELVRQINELREEQEKNKNKVIVMENQLIQERKNRFLKVEKTISLHSSEKIMSKHNLIVPERQLTKIKSLLNNKLQLKEKRKIMRETRLKTLSLEKNIKQKSRNFSKQGQRRRVNTVNSIQSIKNVEKNQQKHSIKKGIAMSRKDIKEKKVLKL